jgi:CRP-like cAMP-binding protein/ribonuclease BN (tRNA processing enzyme)
MISKLEIIKPADGSRVVRDALQTIIFGQPPEVLKGLLLRNIQSFDTLVLVDSKARDGSLLNNLEFPLYYFLFMGGGFAAGRRINLVGDATDIRRVMRLLHLTLLGPNREELQAWGTDETLREEWLGAAEFLALKDADGAPRQVESFFNIIPFTDDVATVDHMKIVHTGQDCYRVESKSGHVNLNLHEDAQIHPPYPVHADFVPRELVKLGLEILGSASGFTANEPCTGLALCYNGDYILIDSIPYLDKHLFARGISKNQISAVFLTHLHDDHCAMFPLMLMPRVVDVITTREIFTMAMEKLSCHLNWQQDVIESCFRLVEVKPGTLLNYYGLEIETHVTVHSIPTIGATFSTTYKRNRRSICVIGDNHGMASIAEMAGKGLVSKRTHENLEQIFTRRFDLLVADGGAGAIHGDPADALHSESERVVFVHVEHLSNRFNTTFSLASSGKRYTVIEGDNGIYNALMNQYLSTWLGADLSNRWSRSIFAEEEIRRYNAGDVIMVQESHSRGYVFLILTGYCEVVTFDGTTLNSLAQLQAGEIIGEMAVITGSRRRNASVVASSPVTVCVFPEATFNAFITNEGHRDKLLKRWDLRLRLRQLPLFSNLVSTILEKLAHGFATLQVPAGASIAIAADHWYVLCEGTGQMNGEEMRSGAEFGCRPLLAPLEGSFHASQDSLLLSLPRQQAEQFLAETPQFNYLVREARVAAGHPCDWLLGAPGS